MHAAVRSQARRNVPFGLRLACRAALLLLPTGLLLLAAAQTADSTRLMFLLGTGFEILLFLLLLFSRQVWHYQLGPPVITLYLVGLGWLWLNTGSLHGWFPHFAQAVLLTVPLVVFAMQTLMDSGALAARHAIRLAKSLADRKDWPTDLSGWRTLPFAYTSGSRMNRVQRPCLRSSGLSRSYDASLIPAFRQTSATGVPSPPAAIRMRSAAH